MKNKIKNVLFVMLVAVVSSALTSFLTTNSLSTNKLLGSVSYSDYLDSSNVTYSDSNVQGAIDELYTSATDYSSINNRVTSLEGYFKNNPTSPTSYFEGRNLWMNGNGTSGDTGIYFMQNNVRRGSIAVDSDGDMHIYANDSSGTAGQGLLKVNGNSIMINGTSINDMIVVEQENVPSFTVNAKSFTPIYIDHNKEGYNCYMLADHEYRSASYWYTHIKKYDVNSVTIDVVNTNDTAYTTTSFMTTWLCIRKF